MCGGRSARAIGVSGAGGVMPEATSSYRGKAFDELYDWARSKGLQSHNLADDTRFLPCGHICQKWAIACCRCFNVNQEQNCRVCRSIEVQVDGRTTPLV